MPSKPWQTVSHQRVPFLLPSSDGEIQPIAPPLAAHSHDVEPGSVPSPDPGITSSMGTSLGNNGGLMVT